MPTMNELLALLATFAFGAVLSAYITTKYKERKWPKLDYAMLAAAVVEVPRWAVAFAAIREPMYAAVPMGLLLAWAASAGWKAYFEDRTRNLLLIINVVSLLCALIVIAPVLYAMTYMPLDEVDLSKVLAPWALAVWATVLGITTFIPLIQVAAVKVYHLPQTAAETPTAQPTSNTTTPAPIVAPSESGGHSEAAVQTGAAAAQPEVKPVKLTPAQRQDIIIARGYKTTAEVMQAFGIKERAANGDLAKVRKSLLQTNGTGVH